MLLKIITLMQKDTKKMQKSCSFMEHLENIARKLPNYYKTLIWLKLPYLQ